MKNDIVFPNKVNQLRVLPGLFFTFSRAHSLVAEIYPIGRQTKHIIFFLRLQPQEHQFPRSRVTARGSDRHRSMILLDKHWVSSRFYVQRIHSFKKSS
jgi:hypothetical protein